MEVMLGGLVPEKCLIYTDDTLIMGKTFEDHQDNLNVVLSRLREAGLKLNPKKCHLVRREVEYLGYIVSEKGNSTDPKKVQAVEDFQTPLNLKSL